MAVDFTPSNVTLSEQPDGTIPNDYNTLIMGDIIENSRVMQLGVFEQMDSQEEEFQYFANGIGAYWVDEGEKIQTTKPTMLQVTMKAKKLGVILVASREYLKYQMPDFFEKMRPKIAEAFYKKFDEAVILGEDNPFVQSIEGSIATTGKIVEGDINYENILELEDVLFADDVDPNAFISKTQNSTALRQTSITSNGVVQSMYDRPTNTIDGMPTVNLQSSLFPKGRLYAGDFDTLRYGIPFNISYRVSEDAQLSTVTNADGSPVNLYEQELIAIRATMDVGMMIVKDEAFAKIEPAPAV